MRAAANAVLDSIATSHPDARGEHAAGDELGPEVLTRAEVAQALMRGEEVLPHQARYYPDLVQIGDPKKDLPEPWMLRMLRKETAIGGGHYVAVCNEPEGGKTRFDVLYVRPVNGRCMVSRVVAHRSPIDRHERLIHDPLAVTTQDARRAEHVWKRVDAYLRDPSGTLQLYGLIPADPEPPGTTPDVASAGAAPDHEDDDAAPQRPARRRAGR